MGNDGMGYIGTLTMIFVVLKLTNLINWSWWWVLSPLWMTIILCVIGAIFVGIYLGVEGK